jgi:predicted lipoprotein with Yx(FWY)xxD motif
MHLTNRISSSISVAAVALGAVSLAACGGGSSTSSNSAKTSGDPTATVDVATSSLGNILVDSRGRTLYLFKEDSGRKSACFGACATNWPPLRASGKPTAGTGVSESSVATIARSDGARQVSYNGHPLYLFAGDSKPGDTNGQGSDAFGAAWLALSPAGKAITAQPPQAGGGGAAY